MIRTALKGDSQTFLFRAVLFLIILLGLYLRVSAVLNTVVDTPVRADARLYYLYSFNIQKSGTFSHSQPSAETSVADAFAPPVYPLAITPFLEFPPTDRMVVNIGLMQAVLGTLTIFFTYLLVGQIGGRMAGLLAAALTAISPHLISLTVYMLTETLFTFLMMGGLLCMGYAIRTRNALFSVASGVLIGTAALTRSTLEYFPLFVLLFSFLLLGFKRFERDQIRNVLIFFGFAVLIVGVWKIRNLVALGMLSDPTLAISTLLHGMYPDLMFEGRPESRGIPYRFDPRLSEISSSMQSVLHEIFVRFQASPWLYLEWYLIGKPISLFSWSMIDGWGDIFVYPVLASPYFTSLPYQVTRSVMLDLHTLLMICAGSGATLILIKPASLKLSGSSLAAGLFLSCLVIYFTLLHIVGAPFPRYGVPLRPVMYGLAVIFLLAVSRQGFQHIRVWLDSRKVRGH